MDFPAGGASKWHMAANLAVGLAQVAHQSGDPVGVVIPGRKGATLPLRTREGVVSEIAAALERVAPAGSPSTGEEIARRRLPSRVVLLSDFLDEDSTSLSGIARHVGQGGEAHALRIVAKEEMDPPNEIFSAVDPERPGVSRLFGPDVRLDYRRRFAEWGAEVAGRWRSAGAKWYDVVTDEPLLHGIRRVVGKAP